MLGRKDRHGFGLLLGSGESGVFEFKGREAYQTPRQKVSELRRSPGRLGWLPGLVITGHVGT